MDGARGAREKNLTLSQNVRVQSCIWPLNAAVVAAGPDVELSYMLRTRWPTATTAKISAEIAA
jgi:hypothetical protein